MILPSAPTFTIFNSIKLHGSGEMFMIGSIKKIFASIFGIFGAILKLPFNLLSSKKNATEGSAPAKQKKNKAFYLEASDAAGVPTPTAPQTAPKAKAKKETAAVAPAAAPAAATAAALNLPQPTVTVTETPTSVSNYKVFGPRRRPGANMKSYLDMAKTIKSA
jgi:hypothetical protein